MAHGGNVATVRCEAVVHGAATWPDYQLGTHRETFIVVGLLALLLVACCGQVHCYVDIYNTALHLPYEYL